MEHPFKSAPDASFWSRTVGANEALEFDPPQAPLIEAGDRVMSMGARLAADLVPFIEAEGFEYVRKETPPEVFAHLSGENDGYTKFSAAYGEADTVRQALQLVNRALGRFLPVEDRWVMAPDCIVDPFRPGLRYPASSVPEFEILTEQHLAAVLDSIRAANVLIFTLGLTEAWVSRADGAVFPACLGTINGEFDPAKHEFRSFGVGEVSHDLREFIAAIREIKPAMRFILMVSPVPLEATASGDHVLIASVYGKSVLRVAAAEAAMQLPDVSYFPAYEIVTGPQAPNDFFESDRRTPSRRAIDAVVRAFLAQCQSAARVEPVKPVPAQGTGRSLSKLIQVALCDEAAAAIDERASAPGQGPTQSRPSEPIRLVIWDLDETYWKGTLSEGGVSEYVQAHHDAVVTLAERGIMSSICSKNVAATVRGILEARGIWDYFIFPSIDWSPKGGRLQSIIESVRLRPESVLFLDDNHGNRAEALAAVPGLVVGDETLAATLLDDPRCAGKDDKELSRLRQYQLLELRAREKVASRGDNTAFLRDSRIVVDIEYDVPAHIDRAVELINRTNQLNFTKRRLPSDPEAAREALREQLAGFGARTGLVSVKDRFGDYGFCGFFLLQGHGGHRELQHFAFSCRVLGMGIEQWVYQRLGKPALDVVGEVISELTGDPDWINAGNIGAARERAPPQPPAVRLRGPTELEFMDHFFGLAKAAVESEVVVANDGRLMAKDHSALLHQSSIPRTKALAAATEPFGSAGDVESHFLDPCEDGTLLVYNNGADAYLDVYRHKSLPLHLPIRLAGLASLVDISNADFDAFIERQGLDSAQSRRTRRLRDRLRSDFELVEEPDDATLARMYREIVARVPPNALLIWVLPGEIFADESGAKSENARQKRLNAYVREAAAHAVNVHVVSFDAAFPVRSVDDVAADGHFVGAVYHRCYLHLRDIRTRWLESTALAPSTIRPRHVSRRSRRSSISP